MIRNLKVLVAAAMALGVLGAVGASGAQAAEFHCSVEPCTGTLKPDGTGKTAHYVFVIENEKGTEAVSFTCGSLSATATQSVKTTREIEAKNLAYSECTVNGSALITIDTNGCGYNLTATGGMAITGCTGTSKSIQFTLPSCIFSIPEQSLTGITYHNIGTAPNREVTAEANVKGIKLTATGTKTNCLINPEQTLSGTIVTGNAIVTGESAAGVMADAWWE